MAATHDLPRWDMQVFYPGLDSPEYLADAEGLLAQVGELEALFDERGVDLGGTAGIDDLPDILNAQNALTERLSTFASYTECVLTTDTRDERALAASSELDPIMARYSKLGKRLLGWLGGIDPEAASASSEVARAHRFCIERAQVSGKHLMSPALESLTSDMEMTGGNAWAKLYSTLTSQISVDVALPDGVTAMPMSAARALASDSDRTVRKAAFEAELVAWKANEVPIAACLNSIKGETILISDRREWGSPLTATCFSASIDLPTLDAMMLAAHESFPTFRRYFRAKARALGLQKLAFYDLFAPLPASSKEWTYSEAQAFVEDNFRSFSDKMADFALRSFKENWIDVSPRTGKVDGAYCAPLRGDESRILLNFKGTYDSARTLAHELGHAYHGLCLSKRTAIQRNTPMTLAETASIFCETIVKEAVLATGTDSEKLTALEGSLTGAAQVVVDITSRFLFEQRTFDLRAKREASPRELCELMRQEQNDTYGDGLDEDTLHPYMWAAKPHYYGSSYYNFPYMFGLLFGLGLYSVYRTEGEAFKARYDDLLSCTGLADAADLARQFGIDIRTPDFWRASLAQISEDVDRFEALIG